MHIALYFTTLSIGGTERVLVRLATQFARMGHHVDLVLMRLGDNAYADEMDSRVRIVNLEARNYKFNLPAFWRYLRRERPDVVISAGDMANAFAAWSGRMMRHRPVLIATEHQSVSRIFNNTEKPTGGLLLRELRRFLQQADAVVCVSAGIAEQVRHLPGMRPEKVHVIHNPAWVEEADTAARMPVDLDWFRGVHKPVVVAVGRLEKEKDYPTLLKAFARLREEREVRLVILGEGSERPALEQLVCDLNLEDDVLLPGFVNNPLAYMSRANLFALSSAHEGFGIVIVEAMACGTPVVSTDCPFGPAEILDDGRYGSLVPVGDVGALAAAMAQQLDHPIPAHVLRNRAREFSAHASATAYLKLIEGIHNRKDC